MAPILLYVPNIIGYVRIILTVAAFGLYSRPVWFVPLYTTSVILDGVDGFTARKLNQCSEFGAWFDVVVDLLGRGLLWCHLYQYGYLVIFLEWLTFTSTHCRGSKWKISQEDYPWLVKKVMANGFKTAWGVVAIGGLHGLPIWLYAHQTGYMSAVVALPMWTQLLGVAAFCVGRTVCMFVELFFVYNHVVTLLSADTKKKADEDVTVSH